MRLDKYLSAISACLLTATLLAAAEVPGSSSRVESTSPIPLPKFVVGEKGTSDSPLTSPSALNAAQEEKFMPGDFTLKTREGLDQGRASNFQDLLRGTPGVFLQSESETEVTKISIRGSGILSEDEPLGVQFLLDGLTLNQADGEVILEDFDLSTIKYAEVYRGADAFKYGGLTLGGAINLVSMTGYEAAPFKFQLEGGSYGYWRGQLLAAGAEGRADYMGSLMSRSRDGFREHSRERLDRFTFNLGFRFSPLLENRLYLTLDRNRRALPGGLTKEAMSDQPRKADDDAVEQDFNKQFNLLRIADKLTFSRDHVRVEAGVFWFHRNSEERGFFSPIFRQGIGRLHSDNFGAVLNSVTESELFGHQNRFAVGVNTALEREYTENFENLAGRRGETTARSRDSSLNLPLHLENLFYLTPKLSLLTGAQLVYARRVFSDLFLTDDQGDQSHRQTFYGSSPKFGAAYATSDTSKVFFNLSRSWQPPSFNNMVQFAEGPQSSVVYKPLRPQHAWTLELGTRGEKGPWEWELSLYHSRVQDELLELNDTEGNDLGAVNVPHSRHRGVEAGLEVDLLELLGLIGKSAGPKSRLTFKPTYTYNDFHFRDDPVYRNHRIAGIPPHVVEAELLYEAPSGFYIGPNLNYVPTRYAVDQANTLFADPYTLVGLKIGLARTKGPSVFLEVRNLSNKTYASSVDPIAAAESSNDAQVFHPGEGRAWYGGVSWTW